MTTVPLAGWVVEPMDLGPASTSVSLVSTATAVAAASSSTVAASLTATGASSTAVTWMSMVSLGEPALVVTENVTVRVVVDGSSLELT